METPRILTVLVAAKTLAERTMMPNKSKTPASTAGVGQPKREASLAAPNGYVAVLERMSQVLAEHKAQDWENLYQDAACEEQNGCHGAAERARNEARIIEQELRAEGKDPAQILRQIEARRRANK